MHVADYQNRETVLGRLRYQSLLGEPVLGVSAYLLLICHLVTVPKPPSGYEVRGYNPVKISAEKGLMDI
jgi:hypothetical protein